MRTQHHRLPMFGTLAAALLIAAGTAAPAVAAADSPSATPIGVHEHFSGVVNGVASGPTNIARINVVCPGPVGGTGHPVAGQTVGVAPARNSGDGWNGYTGPAHQIAVDFGVSTANKPLVLTTYGEVALPTTLDVPCAGRDKVAFNPVPVGDTTFSAFVAVEYVNIAN